LGRFQGADATMSAAMPHSRERILTTHVGSLPRPAALRDLLLAQNRGEPVDEAALERAIVAAVEEVVARQVAIGIDIVDDGEASKVSYSTYIQERLSGFGAVDPDKLPRERLRDREEFPDYFKATAAASGSATRRRLACVGPVAMQNRESLKRDLANFRAAVDKSKPVGTFLTAASPGVIARFHPNLHYAGSMEYRRAVGEAMREEYEAIVAAGFTLQVDCPDLASGKNNIFIDLSDEEFVKECEISVEVLNEALRNIPAAAARMHLCWGNYIGPHLHDIALEKILPVVLKAKPHAISFEGANPRHAHEWEVWKRVKLPDDKVIMPGVLDTSTNYVEHPELVAQRLCRYADAVGRERVIASSDCGFEHFAGHGHVDPQIVVKKLEAMVAGARLASERLWAKRVA
jgi:5-methyltetrahydropteroyltriglutamate--homocysteine methyltransferase